MHSTTEAEEDSPGKHTVIGNRSTLTGTSP